MGWHSGVADAMFHTNTKRTIGIFAEFEFLSGNTTDQRARHPDAFCLSWSRVTHTHTHLSLEPRVCPPADAHSIPHDFLGKWYGGFCGKGAARHSTPSLLCTVVQALLVSLVGRWRSWRWWGWRWSSRCPHCSVGVVSSCTFAFSTHVWIFYLFFFPSLYIETNKLFLNHVLFFCFLFKSLVQWWNDRRWKVRSILIIIQMLIETKLLLLLHNVKCIFSISQIVTL